MKLQKQLFRHKPDEGIFGDCYRTCIACLLGLDPDEVPHEQRQMESDEFVAFYDNWLKSRGLHRLVVVLNGDSLDDALATAGAFSNGMPYIFSGTSRTGVNHAVIGKDRTILHDPSLTDAGIIGPTDNGYYYVEWLVVPPLQAARPSAGPAGGQPPEGGERPARPR